MTEQFAAEFVEIRDGVMMKGVKVTILENDWVEVLNKEGKVYLFPKEQIVRIRKVIT